MPTDRAGSATVAIGVVMPVRNAAPTIDRALRSLVAQSFGDWELDVVDDGSTDGTTAALRRWAAADPRIRVHRRSGSLGVATRLNEAIRLSRGAYLARMDGDDVSYPHRFAVQKDFLDEHRDVDLVGAHNIVFHRDGVLRGTRAYPLDHAAIVRSRHSGIALAHPVWFGRRGWFERHAYDARAVGCEDQELLLRACAESRYANVDAVLLGYREDRIKLRSALRARRAQISYLLRDGARTGALPSGAAHAALHIGKALRDAMAVTLRAEDAVLSRRNRTATVDEHHAWEAVWSGLTDAAPERRCG